MFYITSISRQWSLIWKWWLHNNYIFSTVEAMCLILYKCVIMYTKEEDEISAIYRNCRFTFNLLENLVNGLRTSQCKFFDLFKSCTRIINYCGLDYPNFEILRKKCVKFPKRWKINGDLTINFLGKITIQHVLKDYECNVLRVTPIYLSHNLAYSAF